MSAQLLKFLRQNFLLTLTPDHCFKEDAIKDQGFFVIADGRTLLAFALAGIPGGRRTMRPRPASCWPRAGLTPAWGWC